MNLMRQHPDKVARRALEHRQAILREGLSRRDLLKMGLLSDIGLKMLYDPFPLPDVPVTASLAAIAAILGGAALASWMLPGRPTPVAPEP